MKEGEADCWSSRNHDKRCGDLANAPYDDCGIRRLPIGTDIDRYNRRIVKVKRVATLRQRKLWS